MKQIIPAGITSKMLTVFVQNSTSTVGGGLTGLVYNSAGLEWYWFAEDSTTSTAISLATMTLGTWATGGFVQVDATNLPGFYEIGIPNTLLAATNSRTWVTMQLQGAANMVPVNIEIELGVQANVTQWLGTAVTSNTGVPVVYTTNTVTSVVASGTVTTVSGNVVGSVASVVGTVTATVPSEVSANVTEWLGTAVTSHSGIPQVYADGGTIGVVTGTVTATVPGAGGTNVNVVEWNGTAVATPNIGGVPVVDVVDWLGTAVTSNTGVPLVDVNGITGTVTATVVGGTITTVTNPVTLATSQLTVRRNEALAGFTFPMYDATTGNPATGLSVSCSISIDGATLVGSTNSPSEVGGGIYKLNLAAADLDGTVITLVFIASSASATIVTLITQA